MYGEFRTLAVFAADVDAAAQHLAKPLADRESKARATIFTGGGGIGLGKFVEDMIQLLFRHADTGILHGKHQPGFFTVQFPLHGQAYFALFGKLRRVAQQVQQHLPQLGLVGIDKTETFLHVQPQAVAAVPDDR